MSSFLGGAGFNAYNALGPAGMSAVGDAIRSYLSMLDSSANRWWQREENRKQRKFQEDQQKKARKAARKDMLTNTAIGVGAGVSGGAVLGSALAPASLAGSAGAGSAGAATNAGVGSAVSAGLADAGATSLATMPSIVTPAATTAASVGPTVSAAEALYGGAGGLGGMVSGLPLGGGNPALAAYGMPKPMGRGGSALVGGLLGGAGAVTGQNYLGAWQGGLADARNFAADQQQRGIANAMAVNKLGMDYAGMGLDLAKFEHQQKYDRERLEQFGRAEDRRAANAPIEQRLKEAQTKNYEAQAASNSPLGRFAKGAGDFIGKLPGAAASVGRAALSAYAPTAAQKQLFSEAGLRGMDPGDLLRERANVVTPEQAKAYYASGLTHASNIIGGLTPESPEEDRLAALEKIDFDLHRSQNLSESQIYDIVDMAAARLKTKWKRKAGGVSVYLGGTEKGAM